MFKTHRFYHILTAASILTAMSLCNFASAQSSTDWSFSLVPSSGSISGTPGSTIGWGYEVSNLSPTDWLFVTDIQASGPFLNCTVDSAPFDYPILAPLASVNVAYDGLSGLAELTWNTNAPVGSSNSGTFTMNADFYDNDPFSGGNYVGDAGIQTAAYQAAVSPAAVPEASTGVSLGVVLLPLLLVAVCCQRKRKASC